MNLDMHTASPAGRHRFLPLARGGLAPWQLRRAQESLLADLAGASDLPAVAARCGLSCGHFSRAFRRTVGLSPHAWRMRQRVLHAKDLMRLRGIALAEIALACGFSDQSHFCRAFARETGISPGAWRRATIALPDEAAPDAP